VNVTAGAAPIERQLSVRIAGSPGDATAPDARPGASVRVQARPLWPLNDPPARFVLTIEDVGSASGPSPVLQVPAARCVAGCSLPVAVTIDWSGGGTTGATSVAWELVATAELDRSAGYVGYGAPAVDVDGDSPAVDAGNGPAVTWLLLIVIEIGAYILGVGLLRRHVERTAGTSAASRSVLDVVVAIAGSSLAVFLVVTSLVIPLGGAGSPVAEPAVAIDVLALGAAVGLIVGVVAWLRGSGAILTVAALALAIVGLPTAGILVGGASPTFAERGLQLGVVAALLLAVVTLIAPVRRRLTDVNLTDGRVCFLAVQVALMGIIIIGSPGGSAPLGVGAVCILALGIWTWWEGSGWILGAASAAIVLAVGALVVSGEPGLFTSPSWSASERLVQFAVAGGGLIGLLAAIGVIAAPPKPERWRPTDAVLAALALETPPAEDATVSSPPASAGGGR
jgi:hypothetical protein